MLGGLLSRPVVVRFIRVALAGAIAGAVASLKGDAEFVKFLQEYVWVAPVVSALAKWARERFGWTWLPV